MNYLRLLLVVFLRAFAHVAAAPVERFPTQARNTNLQDVDGSNPQNIQSFDIPSQQLSSFPNPSLSFGQSAVDYNLFQATHYPPDNGDRRLAQWHDTQNSNQILTDHSSTYPWPNHTPQTATYQSQMWQQQADRRRCFRMSRNVFIPYDSATRPNRFSSDGLHGYAFAGSSSNSRTRQHYVQSLGHPSNQPASGQTSYLGGQNLPLARPSSGYPSRSNTYISNEGMGNECQSSELEQTYDPSSSYGRMQHPDFDSYSPDSNTQDLSAPTDFATVSKHGPLPLVHTRQQEQQSPGTLTMSQGPSTHNDFLKAFNYSPTDNNHWPESAHTKSSTTLSTQHHNGQTLDQPFRGLVTNRGRYKFDSRFSSYNRLSQPNLSPVQDQGTDFRLNPRYVGDDRPEPLSSTNKPMPHGQELELVKKNACNFCPRSFDSRKKLSYHLKSHQEAKQCPTCGMRFMHQSDVSRHQKEHTEGKQYIYCELCSTFYLSEAKASYICHRNDHDGPEGLKCDNCSHFFKREDILKWHQANLCKGIFKACGLS